MSEMIKCFGCGKEFERGVAGSSRFICAECVRARRRDEYRESHPVIPSPQKGDTIKCSRCNDDFILGSTGSKGYVCAKCKREDGKKLYYVKKESKEPIKCNICGNDFIRGEPGSQGRRCPVCHKEYKTQYYLNHMQEISEKGKKYREKNPDKKKESDRKYREENLEKILEYDRKRHKEHAEERNAHRRAWYRKPGNKERFREYFTEWAEENHDKLRASSRERHAIRSKIDPDYMMRIALRSRVEYALKYQKADRYDHMANLVGCSIQELHNYIESKFTSDMTWDNYGVGGWELDHIIPCSYWDLTDEVQQRECFNFSNLQPMWAAENRRKSDILPDGTRARDIIRN